MWPRALQKHGNHPRLGSFHALVERHPHLLVLPRPEPPGSEEDGDGAAVFEGLFQALLPRLAGDQVPFVKKGLEPGVAKLAGQRLDRRLVRGRVGEEDIVPVGFGHRPLSATAGVIWAGVVGRSYSGSPK